MAKKLDKKDEKFNIIFRDDYKKIIKKDKKK